MSTLTGKRAGRTAVAASATLLLLGLSIHTVGRTFGNDSIQDKLKETRRESIVRVDAKDYRIVTSYPEGAKGRVGCRATILDPDGNKIDSERLKALFRSAKVAKDVIDSCPKGAEIEFDTKGF